jgi:hypothetical protein
VSEHDRALIEALLRAVRSFRHASHAAELAILKWMEARGYLPDPAAQKDGGTGDRKVR